MLQISRVPKVTPWHFFSILFAQAEEAWVFTHTGHKQKENIIASFFHIASFSEVSVMHKELSNLAKLQALQQFLREQNHRTSSATAY